MIRYLIFVIFVAFMSGCASAPNMDKPLMSASFYDIKEHQFSLKAIAPKEAIREYAICKAIWFAEHKKAPKISLSNPRFGDHIKENGKILAVPKDWLVVNATAYLSNPNPDGNPFVSVKEWANRCRSGWEWYR